MSKFTQAQKEQLKRCVIESTVRRLTFVEMQQYVKEKMQLEISIDYLGRIKNSLRKDSQKQLSIYHKDKFAFVEEIFFKRVKEYEHYQHILHDIIANSPDNPIAQVKAIHELSEITASLANLFHDLPGILSYGVDSFPRTPPTPTTTTTPSESPI